MAGLSFLVVVLSLLWATQLAYATPEQCDINIKSLEKQRTVLELMVDANGKAIDDLGKWDQCKDLGNKVSHYCTAKVALNVSIPTPYVGLCLPVNCTFNDLVLLSNVSFSNITMYQRLAAMEKTGMLAITCPEPTPSPFSSPGAVVVLLFSFLIVLLVLFGTFMDGYDANWWPEPDTTPTVAVLGGVPSINQEEGEVRPLLHNKVQRKSKLFDFLVAFSLARNFKSLVGPSPPALAFLNGMRAISITWVILGHSLDYMSYAGVLNYVHVITKDVLHASAMVFPGAEFSVDSFFWLSGFLVTYLTVQELKNKKRINWFLYYFHRIWRLSPAYFYALFFYIYVSVYLSDGPMWPKYMEQVNGTCGKYWWTNLLYVNNFVPSLWLGQCFLWGWYLAVDMQLYIIAPIVFIVYYKNRTAGWVVVLLGVVASVVATGVIAHEHKLEWNNTDPHVYMSLVYGKPYTRAAPWFLGIACGFLYLEKRQLTRLTVYVGWVISGTVMLLCVYGPSNQFKQGPTVVSAPINTWGSGSKSFAYFTFSKLGWSLALSFIMYSMSMGWGGFVRRFLGAPMWSPLARLTYSAYLFHPIIMFVVYYSHLQYFSYDHFFLAIIFVGILFLSFCTAAVMFLTLERPMTNMEKLFLPHKKN